eukprot:10437325-Alexandrium_andersonii.AAC.1
MGDDGDISVIMKLSPARMRWKLGQARTQQHEQGATKHFGCEQRVWLGPVGKAILRQRRGPPQAQ